MLRDNPHLRNTAIIVVFLVVLAAGLYTQPSEDDSLIYAFFAVIAVAVASLAALDGLLSLWDRFKEDPDLRATEHTGERSEEAYLNGRLKAFENEERLFVKLAGNVHIETRFHTEDDEVDDIAKVIEKCERRFVLVGEPGAGKSTTLRHLMTKQIRQYQRNPSKNRLPLWINLGLSSNPVDADALMNYWWDKQHYLPGTFDQYLRQNNLWLFLDGLNEMPLDTREDRAQSLHEFLNEHPDLPAIVTCRVRDYQDDEKLLMPLHHVLINDLDEPRIRRFIKKRRGDGTLWDRIQENEALLRLARRPYTLVMLLEIDEPAERTLPSNLNELYGLYVAAAYRDYTERHSVYGASAPLLQLKWHTLERRLKRLAYRMIAKGKGTAAEIDWARQSVGNKALKDGLNLGVLVRDGNNIRFYHQSLHGFFAIDRLGKAMQVSNRFDRLTKNPAGLIRQIADLGAAGAPFVEAFTIALEDEDKAVRRAAVRALRDIGVAEMVEPLSTALHDEEDYIRIAAAEALGEIGDARAVEPLASALNHEDTYFRMVAAVALGEIGSGEAVESLASALNHEDRGVRESAAYALGKIGGVRSLDALINALNDENEYVRAAVTVAMGRMANVTALTNIGPPHELRSWDAYLTIITVMEKVGEPVNNILIAALKEEYGVVQKSAEGMLGEIGDTGVVDALIEALSDPDPDIRMISSELLGITRDSNAVVPLVGVLSDDWWRNARLAAAEALGEIGDRRAVKALLNALNDVDDAVRGTSAWALGIIGDGSAIEALVSILNRIGQGKYARRGATWALGEIGDRSAISSLRAALNDDDADVRELAAWALGEIGDTKTTEPLDPTEIRVETEDDIVVEPLTSAIDHEEEPTRSVEHVRPRKNETAKVVRSVSTAQVRSRIGANWTFDSLITALNDGDWRVRLEAAQALGEARDARAVDSLITTLQDQDWSIRELAAWALGEIGDARAVDSLITTLNDGDRRVQWAAAGALVKVGKPAIDPLNAILNDAQGDVRRAATEALEKIQSRNARGTSVPPKPNP